mmetsp:Transcript_203/g.540  ORF Transcript_203/g.540 Transcript_203/m.540 type:complete len:223 (+) Transcript_203:114-782(+)
MNFDRLALTARSTDEPPAISSRVRHAASSSRLAAAARWLTAAGPSSPSSISPSVSESCSEYSGQGEDARSAPSPGASRNTPSSPSDGLLPEKPIPSAGSSASGEPNRPDWLARRVSVPPSPTRPAPAWRRRALEMPPCGDGKLWRMSARCAGASREGQVISAARHTLTSSLVRARERSRRAKEACVRSRATSALSRFPSSASCRFSARSWPMSADLEVISVR